ncbi:MAG: histidine--tRNA ligase [Nanoarchaeota archaeon]|nr:histidine--tRNA ligase [Nanoarchaeota archaeon]
MLKNNFKIAKGVKDWYGKDAILRNEIKDKLRTVFERYGFNPIETPMIERTEVLGYKGGGEIQKEVFAVTDQAKRTLALRFDQTVPLARFYAGNKDIKLPFKRYAIGEVFRDGPTQPEQGRYRIFTQCDIDILGVNNMTAEADLLALARDAFYELGLGEVEVNINNRKLLDGILDFANIEESAKNSVIVALDKMDKIGLAGVKNELENISSDNEAVNLTSMNIDKLIKVVDIQGTNEYLFNELSKVIESENGKEGLNEVKQLLDYSSAMNLNFVKLNPSLARGLDYYTGTTIEVYLQNKDIVKSAILAGGRYDNMVGDFKGNGKEVPAVGMSFGLERLAMIMDSYVKDLPKTKTELYLIPLNTTNDCLKISQYLRSNGLNVDMEFRNNKKLGKSINYAESSGINYVGIIGEDEMKKGTVMIKNLRKRIQEEVKLENVIGYLAAKD